MQVFEAMQKYRVNLSDYESRLQELVDFFGYEKAKKGVEPRCAGLEAGRRYLQAHFGKPSRIARSPPCCRETSRWRRNAGCGSWKRLVPFGAHYRTSALFPSGRWSARSSRVVDGARPFRTRRAACCAGICLDRGLLGSLDA